MAKYIVVTGASKDTYWYADKIGEIFEVLNEGRNNLEVVYDDGTADGFYVNRDDCKEVDNILDIIANLTRRVSTIERDQAKLQSRVNVISTDVGLIEDGVAADIRKLEQQVL